MKNRWKWFVPIIAAALLLTMVGVTNSGIFAEDLQVDKEKTVPEVTEQEEIPEVEPVLLNKLVLKKTKYVYNGKTICPVPVVKDISGAEVDSSYYQVTYKKNQKVGTATVTVTVRKEFEDLYKGKLSKQFQILPKKTSIKTITAQSKGFSVSWKKIDKEITGYQLAYSTGNKVSGKNVKYKKFDKSLKEGKITGLSSGKTYQVWMRTYHTVGKKNYYSAWSKGECVTTTKYLVAIDAGHQRYGNSAKEPNGPGSSQMKAKVTGGAQGVSTRQTEYELNLAVAKKLRDVLKSRGYEVLMIRESNDVNISNVERAQMANNAGADAFIRVHANSMDSASCNGAMTICQTKNNPYCKTWYAKSKALSESVLSHVVSKTGCRREKVWETDTMTGINWCQVPVTIIEMGYLSNPSEDRLLATDSYRQKMAEGIADGIDEFFAK